MILQGENLLLSFHELKEKYHVPESTLYYGKSQLQSSWACYEIEGEIYVDYNSIPPATKGKLPTYDELISEYELSTHQLEITRMVKKMRECASRIGAHFTDLKDKYGLPDERCRDLARKWAVWEWILQNYERKHNGLEKLFNAYSQIFPGAYSNKYSLSNFMKKCFSIGIEAAITDGRALTKNTGKKSPHRDTWITMISAAYAHNKKWNIPEIHKKITLACNDANIAAPSESTVKAICRKLYKNTDLYAARYGEDAAKQKLPYATLIPAENIHDQWQMDGWTLPFWGEKFQRYVLIKIHDNHSRKIVGYSIARTEGTQGIMECFEDAIINAGGLPAEIVCDKHSFHRTPFAARLKEDTERMGMTWTVTINPQHNGIAERYNNNLNSICKEYHGYLGKNMSAKGKDARLSAEVYEQLRKAKNMLSEDEIKAIAVKMVDTFNNTALKELNGLSPNQAYEQSRAINAFKMSKDECLKLLRPIEAYKVSRGQITIKRGAVKYEFQLPAHLIAKYNDEVVSVVYDDLSEGIYIVDPQTGEMEEVRPKPKIHSAKVNQTEEDRKHLNQLAARRKAVSTKQRKASNVAAYEAMKNDPDAVYALAPYMMPKDVRQELLQNRELKIQAMDKGVAINKLPARKTDIPFYKPENTTSRQKDRDSPFAENEKSVPAKLDYNDLIKQMNQL